MFAQDSDADATPLPLHQRHARHSSLCKTLRRRQTKDGPVVVTEVAIVADTGRFNFRTPSGWLLTRANATL